MSTAAETAAVSAAALAFALALGGVVAEALPVDAMGCAAEALSGEVTGEVITCDEPADLGALDGVEGMTVDRIAEVTADLPAHLRGDVARMQAELDAGTATGAQVSR